MALPGRSLYPILQVRIWRFGGVKKLVWNHPDFKWPRQEDSPELLTVWLCGEHGALPVLNPGFGMSLGLQAWRQSVMEEDSSF